MGMNGFISTVSMGMFVCICVRVRCPIMGVGDGMGMYMSMAEIQGIRHYKSRPGQHD